MTFDPDVLRQQIPYYLTTDPERQAFFAELKALISGAEKGYFLDERFNPYADDILQGDGCEKLQILSFKTGTRIKARGIILSNSCDMAPDNKRFAPPNLIFSPMIKLSSIIDRMKEGGLKENVIKGKIDAIRKQIITSVFYLPASGPLDDEYVFLLDDIHTMPIDAYDKGCKLFTLSMAGFYLFVFKLSIHFCRIWENVDRSLPHDK
jgi:hypothetical protein